MHTESIETTTARAVVSERTCGLIAGTGVYTADGVIPVEYLTPGDRIITRDNGVVRLRALRRGRVTLRPIVVKAGSLGFEAGEADIAVPPQAMLHIRDWRAQMIKKNTTANIAAKDLVDGEFVAYGAEKTVQVCELQFDQPQTVYADGLELRC